MKEIKAFNPVAKIAARRFKVAERPKSLENKTIGLFWNGKGGGDIALRRMADNIKKELGYEFKIKEFKDDFPSSPYMIEKVSSSCAAVIGATGD